jgi:hypothetical protein
MPVATIRFSQAKRNFARVAARAKRGDTVVLRHGSDDFQLVYQPPADPVPIRPAGYFKLSAQDLAEINGGRTDETA